MTTPDDPSLSLPEVRERFASSAKLLDQVQGQLQRIVEGEDHRTELRGSLTVAAVSIDAFVKEASAAASALSAAQQSASEAFASLGDLVDGSDLRTIREGVAQLQESLETVIGRQQMLEDRIAASFAQLTETQQGHLDRIDESQATLLARLDEAHGQLLTRLAEEGALREQLSERTKQLEALKAAAGARAIRRAGLDDAS